MNLQYKTWPYKREFLERMLDYKFYEPERSRFMYAIEENWNDSTIDVYRREKSGGRPEIIGRFEL